MRRPSAILLAVLAVATQVALGPATRLGVVLCIGESHAAFELAADDCCGAHGDSERGAVALERTCCSDVPLLAAASLNDAASASGAATAFAMVASARVLVVADSAARVRAVPVAPRPIAAFARRSVALRV